MKAEISSTLLGFSPLFRTLRAVLKDKRDNKMDLRAKKKKKIKQSSMYEKCISFR